MKKQVTVHARRGVHSNLFLYKYKRKAFKQLKNLRICYILVFDTFEKK